MQAELRENGASLPRDFRVGRREKERPSVAQFKGTIYVSARMFAEQRFGGEGLERILASLSESDRDALRQITPVGWYPIQPILDFHRALDRTFGTGNLDLCFEVGRFSSGWALNTVLKLFVKLKSPHWLVERAASVWGRHHDTGRWQFDPPQPRRMSGKLHEFAVRDDAFCARFRGWLVGAIELTGGQRVHVVERACSVRGHQHHEYVATWE